MNSSEYTELCVSYFKVFVALVLGKLLKIFKFNFFLLSSKKKKIKLFLRHSPELTSHTSFLMITNDLYPSPTYLWVPLGNWLTDGLDLCHTPSVSRKWSLSFNVTEKCCFALALYTFEITGGIKTVNIEDKVTTHFYLD